jgi:feruloyl esterase
MAHCAGGPATDRFDALRALVDWVERGQAPDALQASAGPGTPWPGRTRPLCRYPLVAKSKAGAKGNVRGGAVACALPAKG